MNLKKLERYLRVNLLGPGPRLTKKEFAGTRTRKSWETPGYTTNEMRAQVQGLLYECFWTGYVFLRRGVVSNPPNPQAGGPPLVGCPRPIIQYICSYPPYYRPFLRPQPQQVLKMSVWCVREGLRCQNTLLNKTPRRRTIPRTKRQNDPWKRNLLGGP